MLSPAAIKDVCDNLPKSSKYHTRATVEGVLNNPQISLDIHMYWATYCGSVMAVQELLDQGCKSHLSGTPHFSAKSPLLWLQLSPLTPKEWKRVFTCWDLLIADGADINFNCTVGDGSGVPLHIYACHPPAIEYLLKKGADPLLKTSLGHTPLWGWLQGFSTLGNGSVRAKASFKLLLDAGVDTQALIAPLCGHPEQTFMDYMYDLKSLRSLIPWAIEQGFDPNHTKQKKSAAARITDAYNRGNPSKEISAAYDAVFYASCEGQKQRIETAVGEVGTASSLAKKI